MSFTPLFSGEYESYTELADQLCREAGSLIGPFIDRAVEQGISIRHVEAVLIHEVVLLCAQKILIRNTGIRKEKDNAQ